MKPKEQILLSLIVARAKGGVIGHQGKMPWHIPSELAHFKQTTLAKPVLMGRKTWESLYVQPLPKRDNLVLSRDKAYRAPGAECCVDFDMMLNRGKALARECGASEMVIIGGAMLYALSLPFADRVYLTEIDADIPGDAWFADLCPSQWRLSSSRAGVRTEKDEYPYSIHTYERKRV